MYPQSSQMNNIFEFIKNKTYLLLPLVNVDQLLKMQLKITHGSLSTYF